MYYGCDYSPEQWLDDPGVLQRDIELMQQAGINCVTMGMFSWGHLEPAENDFRLDWLAGVLDRLHAAGLKVILGTPSGARPRWLARRYPEVLRVNARRERMLFGERHNHCYTAPGYRKRVQAINTRLAQRFAGHPAVVLWHLSNEYGGECHCDLCQEAFRGYLQERYRGLDALNRAWWNSFWSKTVTDWQQIESPSPIGESSLHGLNLDWRRFVTHQTRDFMLMERDSLLAVDPAIRVTTNLMMSSSDPAYDPGLDYWKLMQGLDVVSWDSYPGWHLPGHRLLTTVCPDAPVDDYRRASEAAFHHDLFRSIGGGKPFLLMESTPSNTNWQPISKRKKPGMNITSSVQAVAHGSDSVQYFQWRQSRGSFEKFHGSVVETPEDPDDRVFRESAELGRLLGDLCASEVFGTTLPARVAVYYDWENRWAFDDSKGPRNDSRTAYLETVQAHYYALWSQGVTLDVVNADSDFSGYELVVVPMGYLMPTATAARLTDFVQNGGTLVATYLTGMVDESDLQHLNGAPGPLCAVLGVSVQEIDVLYPGEQQFMQVAGCDHFLRERYALRDYCAVVAADTAEVLGSYTSDYMAGSPVVTRNHFGAGHAFFLASRGEDALLHDLYSRLIRELELPHERSRWRVPHGVDVRRRGEAVFVMNFTGTAQSFEPAEGAQLLYGRATRDNTRIVLDPYHTAVFIGAGGDGERRAD
ncbi:beta-galactosidase [Spirochaeta africana DSM 8902]|uniref:Beta-galactosidase n=2 Tax=Spirochaeta TaxID=146 RepID=H9ULN0_SPIAZ|nr:beta-galactosidase [Spirochaeta africana DSM 8902]